jgi:hypothetical protein
MIEKSIIWSIAQGAINMNHKMSISSCTAGWLIRSRFLLPLLAIMINSLFTSKVVRAQNPEFPGLAQWESNMRDFGRSLCDRLRNYTGFDEYGNPNGLIETYYDGESVFYRIAEYDTANAGSWWQCAQNAERIYRDRYVLDAQNCNDGFCPGFWNFTEGMRRDFVLTGDQTSQQATIALSRNAAFARDNTSEETSQGQYMREVAYTILSYLDAEDIGEPRRARLATMVDDQLGHFEQVLMSGSPNGFQQTGTNAFMVGLAAQALIRYYEKTGDTRILPKMKFAADKLWEEHWDSTSGSFWYYNHDNNGMREPAPDLNLLIVPLYGWVYRKTGEVKYLNWGDSIFASGVQQAFLAQGKQFNQNYRWSFDYVKWRSNAPEVKLNVGGRVITVTGRGVSKARVTITNINGETQSTLTNPFGFCHFSNVLAGETYVLSVKHKSYLFTPQVLTVTRNTSEFTFTPKQ